MDDITCPFCNDTGFDKIGLKHHLESYCQPYQDTISPAEDTALLRDEGKEPA